MTEEIGWRWYALPMLQAERSALSASLVLARRGLCGTCRSRGPGDELAWPPFPPVLALAIVALTILFTWAYNGTGGSLLIVLLFHAAINFTLTLVPVQPTDTMPLRTCLIGVGLLWAAAIVVVIAEGPTRLTRKPSP